jgi:hypothetical protein
MPADYKYEHISLGRLKALKRVASEARSLCNQIAVSEVISPAVVERLRIICVLIDRAAANVIASEDVDLLGKMFGEDLGEEKQ